MEIPDDPTADSAPPNLTATPGSAVLLDRLRIVSAGSPEAAAVSSVNPFRIEPDGSALRGLPGAAPASATLWVTGAVTGVRDVLSADEAGAFLVAGAILERESQQSADGRSRIQTVLITVRAPSGYLSLPVAATRE
jgi:hypothetical protein